MLSDTFNLNVGTNKDTPLLFIFHRGQLQGILMGKLELSLFSMNMEEILNSVDLNLFDGYSDKMLKNCFFTSKAIFGIQVAKLFNAVLGNKSTATLLSAINTNGLRTTPTKAVQNALVITTAIANISPKITLISALTMIVIHNDVLEWHFHFKTIVIKLGWSDLQNKFPFANVNDISWIMKYAGDIWRYIYLVGTDFLRLVGICMETLQACIQDIEVNGSRNGTGVGDGKEEEEPPVVHDPTEQVINDPNCDEVMKVRIRNILNDTELTKLVKYEQILNLMEDLRTIEIGKGENRFENFSYLLQLLDYIKLEFSGKNSDEEEEQDPTVAKRRSSYYAR